MTFEYSTTDFSFTSPAFTMDALRNARIATRRFLAAAIQNGDADDAYKQARILFQISREMEQREFVAKEATTRPNPAEQIRAMRRQVQRFLS